jgi:signal transduction histidine kinase
MHSKRNTRLGLIGMRERLEMVGGKLVVESSPGKGTMIQALIPLANCRGEEKENPLMEAAKTKP